MMSAVPDPSMSASRMRRPSNRSRRFEPGRVVHGHFRAEAAVAEIGPVAHFAVANANQVGEAVAGEVGEEDRFRPVGEDQLRAFFLVEGLRHALRGAETRGGAKVGERLVPPEGIVLADQEVGDTRHR